MTRYEIPEKRNHLFDRDKPLGCDVRVCLLGNCYVFRRECVSKLGYYFPLKSFTFIIFQDFLSREKKNSFFFIFSGLESLLWSASFKSLLFRFDRLETKTKNSAFRIRKAADSERLFNFYRASFFSARLVISPLKLHIFLRCGEKVVSHF